MIGTKYLSEAVNINNLEKEKLKENDFKCLHTNTIYNAERFFGNSRPKSKGNV